MTVMRPYVVRQGDYLAKLAYERGVDPQKVWHHEKNDALRDKRANPNQLYPGDILYLPPAAQQPNAVISGGTHRYQATPTQITITLTIRDAAGPLGTEPYTAQAAGFETTGTSDPDGKVTLVVPVAHREVQLLFTNRKLQFPIRIGEMDPVGEPEGLRKRLHHLGHLATADADGPTEINDERTLDALKAFQRERGLAESGIADETTRQQLQDAHGS